jgi:hypothetical protein
MLSIVISFILLLFPATADFESFEGRIDVVQKTHYETSYFSYFVKNNNVRIDKFDADRNLIQSLIIRIDKQEVFILSPSKKLYTQLEISTTDTIESGNYKILKTENSRIINGAECYQWRVKNIERNTEVAYWVLQNSFYFFDELIKLLNKTDQTYAFFEKIPDNQGYFPILCVERTLLRKEKLRTHVVNINNEKLNESKFNIPEDYKTISN